MATASNRTGYYLSAAAPALDRPWPRPEGRIESLVGRAHPALSSRLSIRVLTRIISLFVVWRLGILLLSLGWGQLPIMTHWPPQFDVMWLWRYSIRWDAGWYLTIAEAGYHYQPGQSSSIAFFPAFPLLIRYADAILPGSAPLAGLVVVHLSLVAALIYISKLIRIDFGERTAQRTIFFLLLFPGAFFLSAIYSESLLLLAVAGSLYHARRGQWWLAALFGILGSATKLVGIMLIVPLAIELIAQRGKSPRDWLSGLWILLAPLGTIAYFTFLQLRFGSFMVFFHTEDTWHRTAFKPIFMLGIDHLLTGATAALDFYPANTAPLRSTFLIFDTLLLWLFLIAGVIIWRTIRPAYGALVLCFALIPAFSGSPQSINRYLAVLFPVFLLLARIRSEAWRNALAVTFAFALAFTTYLFVNGLWAG